jgi:hypothetical protein
LLRRYIPEVLEHRRTLLGSGLVVVVLWISARYGPLLESIVHLVPWLTLNRIILVACVVVFSAAQYLAWRKLRLSADRHGPEVDDRLHLVEEKPGLTDKQSPVRRMLERDTGRIYPDYYLSVTLRVKTEVAPPALIVECTAPIYQASAFYFSEQRTASPSREPRNLSHNRVLLVFHSAILLPGRRITINLYSPVPISVKSIDVATDEH